VTYAPLIAHWIGPLSQYRQLAIGLLVAAAIFFVAMAVVELAWRIVARGFGAKPNKKAKQGKPHPQQKNAR